MTTNLWLTATQERQLARQSTGGQAASCPGSLSAAWRVQVNTGASRHRGGEGFDPSEPPGPRLLVARAHLRSPFIYRAAPMAEHLVGDYAPPHTMRSLKRQWGGRGFPPRFAWASRPTRAQCPGRCPRSQDPRRRRRSPMGRDDVLGGLADVGLGPSGTPTRCMMRAMTPPRPPHSDLSDEP